MSWELLWPKLLDLGIGLTGSVLTTIFLYYKFLKKIPENVEEKINQLLNERLGYVTTNHNAIINKLDMDLNPRNSTLSEQHHQIYQKVEKVHDMVLEDKSSKSSAFDNMNEEQKKFHLALRILQISQRLWIHS